MTRVGVCIGINYLGHKKGVLHGCINDATNLEAYLKSQRNFDDVTVMTDNIKNKGTPLFPTGQNIIQQLYQLAIRTHQETVEEIWISYSGHGAQIRDRNGDEEDGLDETILPVDYQTRGVLTDDLLFHVLNMVHKSTRCMVLMDCCHSGTALDLAYKLVERQCQHTPVGKTLRSNVIMISGCKDTQTSADIQGEGAMTRAFLDTMDTFDNVLTLRGLVLGMRAHIRQRGLTQVPQMCMSRHQAPNRLVSSVGRSEDPAFLG